MTTPRLEWLSAGEHEVPADDAWLTVRELEWLSRMRFPKRRLEFRLARWCAKAAVAMVSGSPPLHEIEIGHLPEGAPAAYVRGGELDRRISMTDRAGWAVCAIAPAGVEVGVDLELVEPRSRGFVTDFFTADERDLALAGEEADPLVANLIWSAKESALKVLRTGLRRDTRTVRVLPAEPDQPHSWAQLRVDGDGLEAPFTGWWQQYGPFLLTLVADHPTDPPRSLQSPPGLRAAQPVHSWLGAAGS
jgi:4'-phosphopantetheinyl transferase